MVYHLICHSETLIVEARMSCDCSESISVTVVLIFSTSSRPAPAIVSKTNTNVIPYTLPKFSGFLCITEGASEPFTRCT